MPADTKFSKVPEDAIEVDFDENGKPSLWLDPIDGTPADAELLLNFLISKYDAKLIRKIDGVDEGIWMTKIGRTKIGIFYDDFEGYGLIAPRKSKAAEALLREIAAELRGKIWHTDDGQWYIAN